jgi:prophage regulatory protein
MRSKIRRLPAVLDASGDKRSSHYRRIQQGLWTKPVKLGPRAVGWPAHECEVLNAARIAGKSEQEIRQLVIELEAARTSLAGGGYDS